MTRKDFIVKSALAGMVSPLAWNMFPGAFGRANATVNLGIIVTGDRGGGLIDFVKEIPRLRLVSCCDILDFRLKSAVEKGGTAVKPYSDYRSMLDDKSVDAVLIATPFNTHAQIAIEALDAGKHVYCEKTLAKGYSDIHKLITKTSDSGQIFQTGHQYHSSRLYAHVIELVKNGKIGKLAAIECQWNRNGNWRRPVPDPSLERIINWRMYREYSGGLAAELCSHQIDFSNWLLGETPSQVTGFGGIDYWKDGRETFDNIHLIFSYPSGVKAKFTCLTSNARDDYKIKLFGDKGTLVLDYQRAWFYPEGEALKSETAVDGVSGATSAWNNAKGYALELEHLDPSKQALLDFTTAVVDNAEPLSDIRSGARTAACVQMALDAMIQQKIVSWNSNLQI